MSAQPGPRTDQSVTRVAGSARAAARELLAVTDRVAELGARFAAAGEELALVGGSVRDALLRRAGSDLDLTTGARPERVEQILTGWADSVWDVGREFGTIGCRKGDTAYEITTYRADAYRSGSRKPEVRFGDSLREDLVRRDFTVNAMALRLPAAAFDDPFVDPFGGLDDLTRGRLRTPGRPEASFGDDPLRMLRAARFAAQLGFDVDPAARSAIAAMADRIEIVSAERVRDELVKLVCAARPRPGLELLVDSGLGERILPELPRLRLEVDEHHRHKDVYEHSLTVLEQAIALESRAGLGAGRPDFVVRFAALMHDVGKPATRRFEPGGGVSFHHHEVVGAKLTRRRMRALRFPSDQVDAVATLVSLHLRFHGYGTGQWSDSAVRRYVRDAGDLLPRLHVLTRADCTTRNRRKAAALRQAYDDLEERISRLAEEEELASIRPDLDGHQIMTILGIEPGPVVGRAYRYLLDVRLDEGPLPPEAVRDRLLAWWADQPEST